MWELYIGNFYFYKLCIQYLKIHQVMGHTGAQQSVVSIPECSRARREVLAWITLRQNCRRISDVSGCKHWAVSWDSSYFSPLFFVEAGLLIHALRATNDQVLQVDKCANTSQMITFLISLEGTGFKLLINMAMVHGTPELLHHQKWFSFARNPWLEKSQWRVNLSSVFCSCCCCYFFLIAFIFFKEGTRVSIITFL